MGLNEVQLLPHPEIHQNFRVKLHNLCFLRRCLMLDDGFKLKCSVDLKKGRGKRKKIERYR